MIEYSIKWYKHILVAENEFFERVEIIQIYVLQL